MTDYPSVTQTLSGWNRYPLQSCQVFRPSKYQQLRKIISNSIARGQGRSYGDAALNNQQAVVLTTALNRLLAFDAVKGILTTEAGVTLQEILAVIVPQGWFLPVTPGTQYATLGGCVACDVHGKNHLRQGSLGTHILALELVTAAGEIKLCTPTQGSDLFWATIGGMGLTGIIGTITLQLIATPQAALTVKQQICNDLSDCLVHFNPTATYQVAWLDCLGKRLKGIIAYAEHSATPYALAKTVMRQAWPLKMAGLLMNATTLRWYNRYYLQRHQGTATLAYPSFFYPLDQLTHWPLLYGKNGLVQYQCLFPAEAAEIGIKTLLALVRQHRHPIFLAVLKALGPQNAGLLSFAKSGFTLAIDMPMQGSATLSLLAICHALVAAHGGRVYLAKDISLTPNHFQQMYPHYPAWLTIKQAIDPQHCFQSSLSRRLGIAY